MCFIKTTILVLLTLWVCNVISVQSRNASNEQTGAKKSIEYVENHLVHKNTIRNQTFTKHGSRIHVASWRWEEFGNILTPLLVLVLAGIIKLLFHHTPILPNYIPESCVLILIGICMGTLIYARHGHDLDHTEKESQYFPRFTDHIFFLILLPPIILDSAYSMHDRKFLDNLGGILVFAVVGTLFNAFFIGYGLYLVNHFGLMGELPEEINTIDCLKFASLIAATDPVAVLAIFQEIGVNISLYFMVFGESLFNDGISVVLYNSMVALGKLESESGGHDVDKMNYLFACISFFTVVFGGLMIGIFVGLLVSFMVKFTHHTQVIEPFLIILMSYLSYILAETVHWSGIISLIGCGVAQKRYAFLNMSKSSLTTVKYSVKTLATFSDMIIFLFLGIVTISHKDLLWNTGFSLWTLFLCQIVRFSGVFLLTAILNQRLLKKISAKEQFIIGYGGLRGAVGFSLAIILCHEDHNETAKMFLTTTLFMVYFTVFLQGGTIKFLVNKLNIAKEEEKVKRISDDVNLKTIDLLMSGVGSIVGEVTYSGRLEKLQSFDEKCIQKWLIRDNVLHKMAKRVNAISLEEHYARLYGPSILAHQKKVYYVLKSIVPDIDILKASISTADIVGNNCDGLKENNTSDTSKPKEMSGDENFKLGNVMMDKAILQRAFSGSAWEKTRKAEYSTMCPTGLSKNYDEYYNPFDQALIDQQKKTRVLWKSAFSQISVDRRLRYPSGPSASNVENSVKRSFSDNGDTSSIEHVYENSKNRDSMYEMVNFGYSDSEYGLNCQDNVVDGSRRRSDDNATKEMITQTSTKSITKF